MNPFAAMAAAASKESDDELRARVLYVGGDGPQTTRAIQVAEGERLDEWAWRYSLKRRQS